MSGFDVNVWFIESNLSAEQAKEIQHHVGSDWVVFVHDPHLDSFLAELRRRYPDATPRQSKQLAQWGSSDPFLLSVDDPRPPPPTAEEMKDVLKCDPTVWNGSITQQGNFASMSILWEQALEVAPYIQALAKTHQLTVFDEDGQLSQFGDTSSTSQPAIFRLSLTLHISGKKPALDVSVMDAHATLVHQVVRTRLDAHLLAQSYAKERHEIGYHLDDPHCLAQAYEWVRISTGLPSSSMESFQLKRRTASYDKQENGR